MTDGGFSFSIHQDAIFLICGHDLDRPLATGFCFIKPEWLLNIDAFFSWFASYAIQENNSFLNPAPYLIHYLRVICNNVQQRYFQFSIVPDFFILYPYPETAAIVVKDRSEKINTILCMGMENCYGR